MCEVFTKVYFIFVLPLSLVSDSVGVHIRVVCGHILYLLLIMQKCYVGIMVLHVFLFVF